MICSQISICHLCWSFAAFPTVRVTPSLHMIAFLLAQVGLTYCHVLLESISFRIPQEVSAVTSVIDHFMTHSWNSESSRLQKSQWKRRKVWFSFYVQNRIKIVFVLVVTLHFLSRIVFIRCILMVFRCLCVFVFMVHCRVCCTDDRRQRWWLTRTQRHLYSRRPWNVDFWHPVDQTLRGLWITSYIVAVTLWCPQLDVLSRFFKFFDPRQFIDVDHQGLTT